MTMADGIEATLVRYRVDGMDCPGCASKIETAVRRLGGTADVRVNYQRQVLALRLDEAATPRTSVSERIRRLGYGVAPVEGPVVTAEGAHVSEPVQSTAPSCWRGAKARLAAV